MLKIGFFGAGKMAQALAKGFLTAGEFPGKSPGNFFRSVLFIIIRFS